MQSIPGLRSDESQRTRESLLYRLVISARRQGHPESDLAMDGPPLFFASRRLPQPSQFLQQVPVFEAVFLGG